MLQEFFMAGTSYRFWDSRLEVIFHWCSGEVTCSVTHLLQHMSCLFVLRAG